jgi:hypothetical protein
MNGQAEFYVPYLPKAPGTDPGSPVVVTLAAGVSSAALVLQPGCRYRFVCTGAFSMRAGIADPGAAVIATDMAFPANTLIDFWSGGDNFVRAIAAALSTLTYYRLSR